MKRWTKWIVIAIVLALLAAGAVRTLAGRKAKQEALDAQQAAQKIQPTVALGASDVVTVSLQELTLGLPVSGPLKAVSSAFVKARVAGELQGLSVREGDFVKAGQVLARVDSTEYLARVRQAQQQAESAKAQVDIARRSFDNNRSLVDQGFISKTALDSSTATLASSEANFRAAQATVDVATKSLDDTVLKAPISGQVSQRLAQPGERVAIDARVVEIVDLSRLELEASLGAADSMAVKVGQSAQLRIESSAQPVTAKVVRVNPNAAAGSRAVLAYLSLESTAGLRQGLYAQGTLNTGGSRALAVPLNAVRTDKPSPYVQRVAGGKVVHQTVELGERGEVKGQTYVEVKGVAEGDTVLSGTLGTVREGTLVKTTQGSN